ncbi:hypothetical protein A8L34_11180 [Bacillus sp. FJAT-27264]|uniref:DUF4179 domain-containing protein n=1 Tax=Paenibacillus sp. (strain DSM 101736 / FJAT-27264) TaxID=1850362 RepID=UPI000807AB13|nr:DUF4179 domain-containing protein [Bacillus sp. FJAT-27264]OBZ14489.1 hypothetical protein A8L34_11180 [Bacillus sp. FJAT-27264]
MNNPDFEAELVGLKIASIEEVPEPVRSRMDITYQMLGSSTQNHGLARKKQRWLRRMILITGSVAVAGLLFIVLGFFSPAMAETLKQIPFVKSVFQLAGDLGLRNASERGLIHSVDQMVTHQGVTLGVSELMYDGSRLSLVLSRESPDTSGATFMETWRGIIGSVVNNIDFYVNGELVNTSWGLSPGGDESPNSVIVTTFEEVQVPDQFEFKMVVRLAELKQDFTFTIPVTKNTADSIVLTPAEVKSDDPIHMSIKRLELSQTTTLLVVEFKNEPEEAKSDTIRRMREKYKIHGLFNINFELNDEQGRSPVYIGASLYGHEGLTTYTTTFEPFDSMPRTLIVKPFIWRDEQKEYISELEFIVPVK